MLRRSEGPMPWCGGCHRTRLTVAFSKAMITFLLSTKRHIINDNSCHKSSFGHADRAISMTSVSLRDEMLRRYPTCRTHRLPRNSGRWRRPKAGSSRSILGDGDNFSQTTDWHKLFTAVVRKDADHSRTFHCCHGAVGQVQQRLPSRL